MATADQHSGVIAGVASPADEQQEREQARKLAERYRYAFVDLREQLTRIGAQRKAANENRAKLVFMIEAHPAPEGARALRPGQPVEVVRP